MAINMPQQTKSPLDAIANALNVVGKLSDMSANSEALDNARADRTRADQDYNKKREEMLSLKDPNSAQSKQERAQAQGLGLQFDPNASAAQIQSSYGPLSEYAQARFKEEGSRRTALAREMEQRKTELAKLGMKIPKGMMEQVNPETGETELVSKAKTLPPDKVLSVNEGNLIPTQLKDVAQTIEGNQGSFGPFVGRFNALNPYNEKAKTIDAQLRTSAQSFGRYMEGGVLRKEDEEKYQKMFPQVTDSPEVARNKLALVNRLLVAKQKSNVEALASSGYDVSGVRQQLENQAVPTVLGGRKSEGLIPEARADSGKQSTGKFGPSVQQNGHTYNWNPQTGKYE